MKDFFLYAVIIGLSTLSFSLWRNNQQNKNIAFNNIETLNDTLAYYKNKQDLWVAEKQVFIGNEKELKAIIKTKNKEFQQAIKSFKKPITAAQIKTETKIDTVFLLYKVEAPPFSISFNETKKHYSLSGLSTNEGLFIHSISIPNTQSIVVGKKKIGFMKYENRIEVINTNPLIRVSTLDGFSFRDKSKNFGLGVFIGVDYTGKPTTGLGFTYSFLRF